MVAPVIEEIYERQNKEQAEATNKFFRSFLQKFFIILKIQSVNLDLYQTSSPATYKGHDMPSLQIILGRTMLGTKIDNSKLNLQVLLEDIKL